MFNATFNNISAISWQSVLLVEELGVPGENHRPVASHWQTLSHNVVSLWLFQYTIFGSINITFYMLIWFINEKDKIPPRYSWNIVESGIKHHKPKPNLKFIEMIVYRIII